MQMVNNMLISIFVVNTPAGGVGNALSYCVCCS